MWIISHVEILSRRNDDDAYLGEYVDGKKIYVASFSQSVYMSFKKLMNVYERILIHKWASLWGSIALKSSHCALQKSCANNDGIGEMRLTLTML